MYSVLIIDDKPLIIAGMRQLINWEAFGIDTVYDATDGQDGLSLAIENKPDIIITDINMPNMSGLEMAATLREKDMQYLILLKAQNLTGAELPKDHWRQNSVRDFNADNVAYIENNLISDNVPNNKEFQSLKKHFMKNETGNYSVENGESLKYSVKPADAINEKTLQSIRDISAEHGNNRVSFNEFTSRDINRLEPFARRYFNEMGVKSPFFRAWFGDWRVNDTTPIKTVPVETIDLSEAILNKGDYYVPDTDWTIHAGKTLREETKHYARGEKVSVKALTAIKDILDNAILLDTEVSEKTSKNKAENTAFMHKLYCPIQHNNETYIAKISVEEFLNASNDIERKAYHLQSIKIETADGHAIDNTSTSMSRSDTVSINSISDLFKFVKSFDKNFSPKESSKVVNEDGTPKVMYHGSPNDFSVFDLKKAHYSGTFGKGFYFTDSNSHALTYGNLYEVYLDVKNPVTGEIPVDKKQLKKFIIAVADNEDYSIENYGTYDINAILNKINKTDLFTALRDINSTAIGDFAETVKLYNRVNGTNFDGVISATETVVFDSNQIKSATDNIGTFDGSQNNIYYSVKDSTDSEQNKQKMYETKAREISDALLRGENPELVTEGYENFDVDDWMKIYDLMNKYYNEANKQASTAQQAEFKQKVSKLFENSLHKEYWNDDMKAEADKRSGEFEYETITNKSTYEKAEKKVNKMGLDKSYLDIMERANSDTEFTADDTAQVLYTMSLLQNEGKYEDAVNVAAAFRNKVTSAAQFLQAMSIINKLSPEGRFILLTRDAKTINEKSRDSIIGNSPKRAAEYNNAVENDKAGKRAKDGKTFVDTFYEKYGAEYVSDEKLTELGERFKQINDIDNKNDLIDLIMRQSKERNTVTTKKMRKALAEQNIEICKDIANKQIFGMLAIE